MKIPAGGFMNDYFTDEILEELAALEDRANQAWRIAWEAEKREEVDTKPLPSWFKKKGP